MRRLGFDYIVAAECAVGLRACAPGIRRPAGRILIPLRDFEAVWRDGSFGDEWRSLEGVSARVVDVAALLEGKSSPRDEPGDAAKDNADAEILSAL